MKSDNSEEIKDLQFQLSEMDKEEKRLKAEANIAQLTVTQTRYQLQILAEKKKRVKSELCAKRTFYKNFKIYKK